MLIGYARVSTGEQTTDPQIAELRAAGCMDIRSETGSGGSRARPVLARLVREIQGGDTLVVVSDGMVEVRNLMEDFWDESEVERILLENHALPIGEIPRLLCTAADAFAGPAEQFDDMTVVAIKIK